MCKLGSDNIEFVFKHINVDCLLFRTGRNRYILYYIDNTEHLKAFYYNTNTVPQLRKSFSSSTQTLFRKYTNPSPSYREPLPQLHKFFFHIYTNPFPHLHKPFSTSAQSYTRLWITAYAGHLYTTYSHLTALSLPLEWTSGKVSPWPFRLTFVNMGTEGVNMNSLMTSKFTISN